MACSRKIAHLDCLSINETCRPSSVVEHVHGKDGVVGSIPMGGSIRLQKTLST